MTELAEEIRARLERELREEMGDITRELLEDAAVDAPTLNPEEHAERHPGEKPLAESGYTAVTAAGSDVIGRVGFTAFYAGWVEERRDWKHDDGKAGYLGDNLKAKAPTLRDRLRDASRRALNG